MTPIVTDSLGELQNVRITNMPVMNLDHLQQRVFHATSELLRVDQFLIAHGQERALVGRYFHHLTSQFPTWHVDTEYNRVGTSGDRKENSSSQVRRPDIIIHNRGKSELAANLLWIEVKILNDAVIEDVTKLKEFTSSLTPPRVLQYQFGLSVSFSPTTQLRWFKDGQELAP